jgi:hypothetical protein
MSLGQFVVVQTRCNWHFHDINIYFLLRKKTCIVVANLCPSMFCLQVKSLDILVSSSYKYTQHGILVENLWLSCSIVYFIFLENASGVSMLFWNLLGPVLVEWILYLLLCVDYSSYYWAVPMQFFVKWLLFVLSIVIMVISNDPVLQVQRFSLIIRSALALYGKVNILNCLFHLLLILQYGIDKNKFFLSRSFLCFSLVGSLEGLVFQFTLEM